MNKVEFEARLNEAYNGTVQPLNSYINKHATIVFKCHDCGLRFFAKPSHMVGKEHQRHVCNMPYGDKNGERLLTVGSRHKARNQKGTSPQEVIRLVDEMIWDDCTYKQVAQKLQVNANIIKDYFETEGLI